ncbi:MAG: NADH-quinone oxidoreductase subunit H [Acidobacteria bacterium]|nr:MAG: NADH-quinone oxidoreductase subunit H [Acidobacteriota bacterium]
MTIVWVSLIKIAIMLFWIMNLASLLTWVERKQSAVMQDRIGANRANIGPFRAMGLFNIAADSIKMIVKEDFVPPGGNKFLHLIAPMISVFFSLMAFTVIPIGNTIQIGGREFALHIFSSNIAILFVFAMLSLEIYGAVFAGYASNNNYSLLGGLRASAQMFSYEITFGATIIGLLMIYGTFDLQELIIRQKGLILGFWPKWGVFVQPLGFILFCAAGLAETKRAPFDLPEGESEIVGYFTEYSGLKFAAFLLVDFLETILIAALATILFLGGWQVPFLLQDGFHFGSTFIALKPIWVTLLQVASFFIKLCIFLWLFMLIRWSLPRFRYDQLMRLGWNIMLPLSLLNIFVTGVILLIWDRFHA